MAHLSILVGSISQNGGFMLLSGTCNVSDAPTDVSISWQVNLNYTDAIPVIHAAITQAAEEAAAAQGWVIGPSDRKIIFSGPV